MPAKRSKRPTVKMVPYQIPDLNRVVDTSPQEPPYTADHLRTIGRIRPKRSVDIAHSALGIGFEMLDRKAFDPEPAYPYLAQSGVKWARVQTGWNRCEKTPGKYRFRWLDQVIDNLLEIGITPWFSVSYGNLLYTPGAEWEGVGGVPLYYGEQVVDAWRKFVGALAQHFKGRVLHWEVWNEPNTGGYWPFEVETKPEDYTELVRITAQEIREEIADAVIIGGAISGIDLDFTVRAAKAGLLQYIDKFSFHPYDVIPERTAAGIRCLRETLDRLGGSQIGLWQGECGQVSRPGVTVRKAHRANEHTQAKYLTRRMLLDLSLGMEVSQFFHACDSHDLRRSQDPTILSVGPIGILDRLNDYQPKRAFYALQTIAALFDSETVTSNAGYLEIHTGGFRPEMAAVGSVSNLFERRDFPLFVYYCPEHPLFDNEAHSVRLRLWTEKRLKAPVLIDPLFNRVYRVPLTEDNFKAGRLVLELMPLIDYPLILTERKAIQDILASD